MITTADKITTLVGKHIFLPAFTIFFFSIPNKKKYFSFKMMKKTIIKKIIKRRQNGSFDMSGDDCEE